ncbi:MAG: hypothetical protein KDA05_01780, partial [Phycisphaerales bacterium]|nr:hypothetical protein [Phycisphaerales bacterium]
VAADTEAAAGMIRDVLAGVPGPRAEFVVVNAAAALFVAGLAPDLRAGCSMAREAIASGKAGKALERLVEVSKAGAGG